MPLLLPESCSQPASVLQLRVRRDAGWLRFGTQKSSFATFNGSFKKHTEGAILSARERAGCRRERRSDGHTAEVLRLFLGAVAERGWVDGGRGRGRGVFRVPCPLSTSSSFAEQQNPGAPRRTKLLRPGSTWLSYASSRCISPRRLRPAAFFASGRAGILHFFPSVPYLVRRAAANRAWVGWMLSTSSTFTRLYGRGNNGITSQCSVCHTFCCCVEIVEHGNWSVCLPACLHCALSPTARSSYY